MGASATDAGANARAGRAWKAAESSAAAARARRKYALGDVADHVALAAAEIAPRFHIGTVLGWGERTTPNSDHPKGLALDFMCHGARGTRLAAYVLSNGARLGATYVIYQQRINSLDGQGWKPMPNRGSATANHMDHVHVSFAANPADANVSPTMPGQGRAFPAGAGTTPGDLETVMRKVAVTGLFLAAGTGLVVAGVAGPGMRRRAELVQEAAGEAATTLLPAGRAAKAAGVGRMSR